MAKFDMNTPFIHDDWDDAADLVMITDEHIAEAEEKSEENADESETNDIGVIDALKESGYVTYDCDDEDEDDVEYDETLDDEPDIVGSDAADYRQARDEISEYEDMEEDEEIDAVIGDDD